MVRFIGPLLVLGLVLSVPLSLLAGGWSLQSNLDAAATRDIRTAHLDRSLDLDYELDRERTRWSIATVRYYEGINLAFYASAVLLILAGTITGVHSVLQWIKGKRGHEVTVLRMQHDAAVAIADAENRHPKPPKKIHYAPNHALSLQFRSQQQGHPLSEPPPAPDLGLPGLTDMATLNHVPTRNSILLGLGPGGKVLTAPVEKLCHVALLGETGGGKSNLLRLLIPQIQAAGSRVVLCDPHFTPIDPKNGEDWRPIAERLMAPPAHSIKDIDLTMRWLIKTLRERLELRRRGEHWGPEIFLALDELPVITRALDGFMDMLTEILNEGRKVDMFVIGAAQSMLVKTLGGDSAAREAYRTCYYLNGDTSSAAALLNLRQRDIRTEAITEGLAYLRSVATQPPHLVRVPLASNEGIHRLLIGGSPQEPVLMTGATTPLEDPGSAGIADTDEIPPGSDAERGLILELTSLGLSRNKIAARLGGNRQATLARIRAVLEEDRGRE